MELRHSASGFYKALDRCTNIQGTSVSASQEQSYDIYSYVRESLMILIAAYSVHEQNRIEQKFFVADSWSRRTLGFITPGLIRMNLWNFPEKVTHIRIPIALFCHSKQEIKLSSSSLTPGKVMVKLAHNVTSAQRGLYRTPRKPKPDRMYHSDETNKSRNQYYLTFFTSEVNAQEK